MFLFRIVASHSCSRAWTSIGTGFNKTGFENDDLYFKINKFLSFFLIYAQFSFLLRFINGTQQADKVVVSNQYLS
jgi:hypothetical protein